MSQDPADYALGEFFGDKHQELLTHVPHCRYLDMKLLHVGPGVAMVRLPYREDLVGDPSRGVVFGGVITTLLDQACGLATSCALAELDAIATLDLRIDYLRAAEPGHDLFGRAECYKQTRNVAFARAVAYDRDSGDPFANCLATFMLGAHSAGHGASRLVDGATP